MESDSHSVAIGEETFGEVACRLGYLSPDDALRVQAEAERRSCAPGLIALELGLLDVVEVDAAETLRRPLEAVPGYEILDVLGRGGMGMVYLARHTSLERIVALKTVLVSRMHDASILRRFEQEARVLAQLRHPNIISVHDFGKASGRLYFAMDRVVEGDVAGLLERNGPLDEAATWNIARQAAAGLAHAERAGIVHRDIKPANLMLVEPPDGHLIPGGVPLVQITDFGLALLTAQSESCTQLTADNTTVGSPHYMAPEQFQGSRVDYRADIYSLGATIYEMLANQPPFKGLTLSQIIGEKLSSGPASLSVLRPDLSRETVELVERMMSREPDGRPPDYGVLLTQIDAVLPGACRASPAGVQRSGPREGGSTVVRLHAETREFPTAVASRPASRPIVASRWSWLAVGCLLFGITGTLMWPRGDHPGADSQQRDSMVEVGPARELFNGVSLSDWNMHQGAWMVEPGSMFSGQDGHVSRSLVTQVNGQPAAPTWYRLRVRVRSQANAASEVQFALSDGIEQSVDGYLVRLADQKVTLGERHGNSADLSVLAEFPLPGAEVATFSFERLPAGWIVTVNDTLLPPLPLRDNELPEFRLAVDGGPAWFSKIELIELETANEP